MIRQRRIYQMGMQFVIKHSIRNIKSITMFDYILQWSQKDLVRCTAIESAIVCMHVTYSKVSITLVIGKLCRWPLQGLLQQRSFCVAAIAATQNCVAPSFCMLYFVAVYTKFVYAIASIVQCVRVGSRKKHIRTPHVWLTANSTPELWFRHANRVLCIQKLSINTAQTVPKHDCQPQVRVLDTLEYVVRNARCVCECVCAWNRIWSVQWCANIDYPVSNKHSHSAVFARWCSRESERFNNTSSSTTAAVVSSDVVVIVIPLLLQCCCRQGACVWCMCSSSGSRHVHKIAHLRKTHTEPTCALL